MDGPQIPCAASKIDRGSLLSQEGTSSQPSTRSYHIMLHFMPFSQQFQYFFEHECYYNGNQFDTMNKLMSEEHCQSECQRNDRCVYYMWDRPGCKFYSSKKRTCQYISGPSTTPMDDCIKESTLTSLKSTTSTQKMETITASSKLSL